VSKPIRAFPYSSVNAFALVFGIGLGGNYMIVPLAAAEISGIQGLGLLLGVILTANGVEAATAWLVGHLRGATGIHASEFALLIVMGLLAVFAASLPKGQKPL